VVVVINNDHKQAELSFDTDFRDGMRLRDRLGVSPDVVVNNKKLKITLPERSVSLFVEN
jgi:hypothetical protein